MQFDCTHARVSSTMHDALLARSFVGMAGERTVLAHVSEKVLACVDTVMHARCGAWPSLSRTGLIPNPISKLRRFVNVHSHDQARSRHAVQMLSSSATQLPLHIYQINIMAELIFYSVCVCTLVLCVCVCAFDACNCERAHIFCCASHFSTSP